MKQAAIDIQRYIAGATKPGEESTLQISRFDGPTSGAAIALVLREHLEDMQAKILETNADYRVGGEFFGDRRGDDYVIKIDAKIKSRAGSTKHIVPTVITTSLDENLALLGQTVPLSKEESEKDSKTDDGLPPVETHEPETKREESLAEKPLTDPDEIIERVKKATEGAFQTSITLASESTSATSTHGSIARTSKSSPYGIEILIKSEDGQYEPCPLEPEGGTARVKLAPEDVYAVCVYNDSEAPVGLTLTIDGINVFHFSQNADFRGLGKMLILPGKGLIKGWHDEGAVSHEFLVSNYGESEAASIGILEGVGTVTAVFQKATKRKDGSEEPQVSIATKRGKETEMKYTRAPYSITDLALGAVSVRYVRSAPPTDLPP